MSIDRRTLFLVVFDNEPICLFIDLDTAWAYIDNLRKSHDLLSFDVKPVPVFSGLPNSASP